MPLYDFQCKKCQEVFEVLVDGERKSQRCPACGAAGARRLPSAPAIHLKGNAAPRRIARRARDYLIDGKTGEAARFLDQATEQVKDERVLRLRDKVQRASARKKRRS